MLTTRIISFAATLLVAGQIGLANAQQPTSDAGPATPSSDMRHSFEGVVAKIDSNNVTITSQGMGDVEYRVENPADLKSFHVGDHVKGEMVTKDNKTVAENVKVTKRADGKDIDAAVKEGAKDTKAEVKEQYGEVKGEVKEQKDEIKGDVKDQKDQPNPEAKKQHDQAVEAATDVKAEGKVETQMAQGDKQGEKKAPDAAEAPAGPSQTGYTDWNDPSAKVYPFEGTVFEVNEPARRITIDAERIPGNPGGETALQYVVPEDVQLSTFHKGDKVVGELVVKDNRTTVRTVQIMQSKTEKDAVEKEQKQDKKDAPQY